MKNPNQLITEAFHRNMYGKIEVEPTKLDKKRQVILDEKWKEIHERYGKNRGSVITK